MIFMITVAITVRTMETTAKRISLSAAESTAERASLSAAIVTCTFLKSSMAKLIIQLTFLFITQHIISFIYFFKPFCGCGISLIAVRMIFFGQFSVCFFYCRCICVSAHAQNFIIVSFQYHHLPSNINPFLSNCLKSDLIFLFSKNS